MTWLRVRGGLLPGEPPGGRREDGSHFATAHVAVAVAEFRDRARELLEAARGHAHHDGAWAPIVDRLENEVQAAELALHGMAAMTWSPDKLEEDIAAMIPPPSLNQAEAVGRAGERVVRLARRRQEDAARKALEARQCAGAAP